MVLHRRSFLAALSSAMAFLPSCGKGSKIRLALNWKPDPEFGGFYAADYAKHGLDIDILPGGAGTPTVQMIGAGSAELGIVAADDALLARAQNNHIVALFAVFQKNPMAIMAHASRNLKSMEELLQSGTLAIQSGLPYARLLRKKYSFDKVRIVPSTGGDLTAFLNDSNFAQQCFVMDEPLQAKRKGVDVTVFPIADTGYNPYTTVLATSAAFLQKNPDLAARMVAAVREGWRTYLDTPGPANERMHTLNPTVPLESLAQSANAQRPLIEATPLGAMTRERWETLAGQLKELGDIPQTLPVEQAFRNL